MSLSPHSLPTTSLSHHILLLLLPILSLCQRPIHMPTKPPIPKQFTYPPNRQPNYNRDWNPFDATSTTMNVLDVENDEDYVVVPIVLGKVIGRREEVHNISWIATRDQRDRPPSSGQGAWRPLPLNNTVKIYTFLGIPYAHPPTNQRRLKAPQLMTKFYGDGIVRALKYGPACMQDVTSRPKLYYELPYEYVVSEDCLYLNIFTPEVQTGSSQRSWPVVVFIHGGAFQRGSANDWPGQVLASKGIVVVTINYRLGALGFAATGKKGFGNMGLLDQRAALQFVQQHIYAFGGDAGRVTLIGHGAGAVSAGLHMLSPISRNLFHAVGAMSGAETSYFQVITKPALAYNNTRRLGRQLGCSQEGIDSVYACIQQRSGSDIIKATRSMLLTYNRYAFLPSVDGYMLPGSPIDLLKGLNVANPVPYMCGVNADDGVNMLLEDRSLAKFDSFALTQPYIDEAILKYTLWRNYTTNRRAVMQAILYKYTYWPDTKSDYHVRKKFIEMASDTYYVAPVSQSAHLHSMAGSFTYMYVNNYNISTGSLRWTHDRGGVMPYWMGICHECDLYLLFGFPYMSKERIPYDLRNITWTTPDRNASELFMTLWEKFAAFKNPNIRDDTIVWPNVNSRERFYLNFNWTAYGDGRTVHRNYRWQAVAFWNDYLIILGDLFTTSFSPTVATLRRELIGYKISLGVFICLFLLMLMLALVFAYQIFERSRRRKGRSDGSTRDSGFGYLATDVVRNTPANPSVAVMAQRHDPPPPLHPRRSARLPKRRSSPPRDRRSGRNQRPSQDMLSAI